MSLGRRHTQSEQDKKAQYKVAWKTLFAEKQSKYPPHPGDTVWMETSKKFWDFLLHQECNYSAKVKAYSLKI